MSMSCSAFTYVFAVSLDVDLLGFRMVSRSRQDVEAAPASLENVPDDVLGNILRRLDLVDLISLERVSKTLRHRIDHLGIPLYLSQHPQSHLTLRGPVSSWSPRSLVRHNHLTSLSLKHRRWHALQIGPTWRNAVIPTISITPDRLLLGIGGKLVVHPLVEPPQNSGKAIARGIEHMISKRADSSRADIIGLAELGNDEIAIAQYDGTLQRFKLDRARGGLRSLAHYSHPQNSYVQTLAVGDEGEVMATTTNSGLVSVFKTRSPWIPADTFERDKAWSSMLSTRHAHLAPALYLGISGGINIHPLRPTGAEAEPSRTLRGPDLPLSSAAYGMTFPPSTSAHHPSLLLSSWFDSEYRMHDLRMASESPVASFHDVFQWADSSAAYCTTFLAEHHIAGGGARHGTVSLFDIRQPKAGWSIFSPGGKGSPVYALKGEGGRLWGVTEKRAFVIAFDGSGATPEGLVLPEARAPRQRTAERPTKWGGRGRKWGWSPRDAEMGEVTSGYDHRETTGVKLFDSLIAA